MLHCVIKYNGLKISGGRIRKKKKKCCLKDLEQTYYQYFIFWFLSPRGFGDFKTLRFNSPRGLAGTPFWKEKKNNFELLSYSGEYSYI